MKRFVVSELKCHDSPVYPWKIENHLNENEIHEGRKMAVVTLIQTKDGAMVVWEVAGHSKYVIPAGGDLQPMEQSR